MSRKEIEIGFNHLRFARNSDFEDENRKWIGIADDWKWFGFGV